MKIAIVGCGTLGTIHANCYASMPGIMITGVCDSLPEVAQDLAAHVGATAYTSFSNMLEYSGCDVVSIAVPSYLHKTFTIAAAEAGKHVICEKPIALNLDDAARMMEVCQENKVRLFIGQVVRFFPAYQQINNIICEGTLGRVAVAHTRRRSANPSSIRSWYADEEKSGGVVLDLMIHDIDFICWSLGKVRSVYGLHKKTETVDYALATLIFESGAIANLEAHWGYPGPFSTLIEVAGSKGLLLNDSTKAKSLQVNRMAQATINGKAVEVPQSPGFTTPFDTELAHFIDCILTNREAIVTPEDAYRALQVALNVQESARSGKVIAFRERVKELV